MKEDGRLDLKVHINGQHTFFLHQRTVCEFSGKIRKLVTEKHEKRKMRSQSKSLTTLKLSHFPCDPSGFELAAKFCYCNGNVAIDPSNVAILHCSATFLEMTKEYHPNSSLLDQAEAYLEEKLFYLDWKDLISIFKSFESFVDYANSMGLLKRLISPILTKISSNRDAQLDSTASSQEDIPSSSSSSSFSSSTTTTTSSSSFCSSSTSSSYSTSSRHWSTKEWWFDDVTTLHPLVVGCMIKRWKSSGGGNKDPVLTRFLLHYLKIAQMRGELEGGGVLYSALADTAVHGVVSAVMGGSTFLSCRFLFWARRVVGWFGTSEGCRRELEALTGAVLDQATLDDLLVCGEGVMYDVGLVVRLVGVFMDVVVKGGGMGRMQRVRKVGRLVDNYLMEVSPDPSLKPEEFFELAKSLPDSARTCFDGVYRAMEIYLESHQNLSLEERTKLCDCLNYEKLSIETCRDLAKNTWVPPKEAVQALISQKSKLRAANSSNYGSSAPSKAIRTTTNSRKCEERIAMSKPTSRNGLHIQKMGCKMGNDQLPKLVMAPSTSKNLAKLCLLDQWSTLPSPNL